MTDDETLRVYDDRVAEYVDMTTRREIDPDLLRFMHQLQPGAHVLDLGCGPGAASVVLRDHGFVPDPVDASEGMVQHCISVHGLKARLATFDEITGDAVYGGIWANFSLLHAPRRALAGHLSTLHTALKPGGAFHIGMKLGEGEHRDRIGRLYSYFSREELERHLTQTGFVILERSFGNEAGLSGETAPWITILAKKKG